MNDIIGAVNSTQLETFVTAKTGWFENLAVGIIQSQKLFSKEITLVPTTDSEGNVTGGGKIQSNNYSETDQTGWQIDYDGNATFNNATVRGKVYATEGEFSGAINAATITGGTISGTEISGGSITIGDNFSVTNEGNLTANKGIFYDDCVFAGNIASGPLYLDEENPTSIESQLTFNSGDSTQEFWEAIKDINYSTTVNGIVTYNNESYNFSHIGTGFTGNGYMVEVHFENKKLQKIDDVGNIYIGTVEKGTYNFTQYGTLKCSISLNIYNPTGKTLKLIDLPTSAASESGYVYKDSEGYLRIS